MVQKKGELMEKLTKDMKAGLWAGILLVIILALVGLFAWWAWSWSTHTLVWFIFVFGSLFGSVKVKTR